VNASREESEYIKKKFTFTVSCVLVCIHMQQSYQQNQLQQWLRKRGKGMRVNDTHDKEIQIEKEGSVLEYKT